MKIFLDSFNKVIIHNKEFDNKNYELFYEGNGKNIIIKL